MKSKLFLTGMTALLLSFGLVLTACEDLTKDSNPAVTGVSVNPADPAVAKGGTQAFTATVSGTNNPPQTVSWEVQGGVSGTGITDAGSLTVAANETAKQLTVKATSTFDTTKSGTTNVTVTSGGKDTTPPGDVSDLAGTPANGGVMLAWTDPADDDLASIEITFRPTAEGVTQPVSVAKAAQTTSITGLANETAYTFTVKTVDAAGNKSGGKKSGPLTPSTSLAFTDIAGISAYLNAAIGGATLANPVSLKAELNLANDWTSLLSAINTAGKYVALDLSASANVGADGEFDPGAANTGENKIESLVLPDAATSIKAGQASSPTFENFTSLYTKVSGANIETIGDYAFRGCWRLRTVSLPKATSIGASAFSGCWYLIEVSLPEATSIGASAFFGCRDYLKTVSLPKATSIGASAFSGCTTLATVSLPEATSIGDSAFSGCTFLETVSLPEATFIGDSAFSGCWSLKTVSLPKATSVGDSAFYKCNALTEVSLPKATSIGDSAFSGCTSLKTVSLPEATSVGDYAFSGCTFLETVSLPEATFIGAAAFRDCERLTTVSLPKATSSIGASTFRDCKFLATVSLPEATSIGNYAFSGCAFLRTVSLPKATSIGDYAFFSCRALGTVSLPKATSIGRYAFSSTGGTALTITLGNTPPTVGAYMFFAVDESKSVTVKVPSGAVSSYDETWKKDFKGMVSSAGDTVNSKIMLKIQGY